MLLGIVDAGENARIGLTEIAGKVLEYFSDAAIGLRTTQIVKLKFYPQKPASSLVEHIGRERLVNVHALRSFGQSFKNLFFKGGITKYQFIPSDQITDGMLEEAVNVISDSVGSNTAFK